MKRIKLTVAYDGTNYCGWQIQDNGITIEEVLNRELSKLLQEDIKIIGASRTDSGVHALGNVAVFDTESPRMIFIRGFAIRSRHMSIASGMTSSRIRLCGFTRSFVISMLISRRWSRQRHIWLANMISNHSARRGHRWNPRCARSQRSPSAQRAR